MRRPHKLSRRNKPTLNRPRATHNRRRRKLNPGRRRMLIRPIIPTITRRRARSPISEAATVIRITIIIRSLTPPIITPTGLITLIIIREWVFMGRDLTLISARRLVSGFAAVLVVDSMAARSVVGSTGAEAAASTAVVADSMVAVECITKQEHFYSRQVGGRMANSGHRFPSVFRLERASKNLLPRRFIKLNVFVETR